MSYGINVTYQVKPGRRREFLDAVAEAGIQKAVQGEAGCIRYDYFLSVSDSDQVLLVDQWENKEAQQVHLTQPHMAQWREVKERLVDSTILACYDLPN